MGFDQYFTKRTNLHNWKIEREEEEIEVIVKKHDKIISHIYDDNINYIIEELGWLRKAYAIHIWMVENVQNGVDDSRKYS